MESYNKHQRMAARIAGLAGQFERESLEFQAFVQRRGRLKRATPAIETSIQWLEHASRGLILASVAIREARELLESRPRPRPRHTKR
jgi:hypothetical protein